jgi:carboxyl-terminal processing protease
MFSQNIKLGGQATLIGEETYGVGDTSTFHLELPGERGISVTAGRVSVGGQASTQFVTPDIAVRDDLAALAASGTDAALQTAFTELLK